MVAEIKQEEEEFIPSKEEEEEEQEHAQRNVEEISRNCFCFFMHMDAKGEEKVGGSCFFFSSC